MNDIYLNMLLLGLIGDRNLVSAWWNTPNRAFEGQLPKDIDQETIKNYLEGHCLG